MDRELSRFLHELHYDTDKAKPPEWQPDWDDAPLPYKLYRGVPAYPLSLEVPLRLAEGREEGRADASSVGHFLWYAYGTPLVSRDARTPKWAGPSETFRRAVPSGGGLYPSELYAYLKLPDLPHGVFHYDAAHHRLILLRQGNFDDYLERALGGRYDPSAGFGAVFVTTAFWKNFFKYYHFSYRLQGLDAGVLIGQLLEVAERLGYRTLTGFQFLDRAVGRLLGLRRSEESPYAVILLSDDVRSDFRMTEIAAEPDDTDAWLHQIPAIDPDHFVRSKRLREYPMLLRMDEACVLDDANDFRFFGSSGQPQAEACDAEAEAGDRGEFPRVPLPEAEPASLDVAELSRRRYTPDTDFVLKPIPLRTLARMLRAASLSCRCATDLEEGGEPGTPRLTICGSFYGVEGLEDGAYRYDARTHAFIRVRPGDHRAWLQYGMTLHNVNLFQVPLCFHIAGDRGHYRAAWGARGYRIQQMEAGMLTQRLLLAAAGEGLAGRPLLGFETEAADDLYRLPARGETALIQIPVGPYRYRSRWEGSLHG